MSSLRKVLDAILSGQSDRNVSFSDLQRILRRAGFEERVRGSHYIYSHPRVTEIINIQELPGGKAKAYQVKQVRTIITSYGLKVLDER